MSSKYGEFVQLEAGILKELRLYLVQKHGKSWGLIKPSIGQAIHEWIIKERKKDAKAVDKT